MKYVVKIGYKKFEGFESGDTALRFAEIARKSLVIDDTVTSRDEVVVELIKEEE